MLWSYLRGRDVLVVETYFDEATHEFVLRFLSGFLSLQGGQIERFKDEHGLRARLDALERDFVIQYRERLGVITDAGRSA